LLAALNKVSSYVAAATAVNTSFFREHVVRYPNSLLLLLPLLPLLLLLLLLLLHGAAAVRVFSSPRELRSLVATS